MKREDPVLKAKRDAARNALEALLFGLGFGARPVESLDLEEIWATLQEGDQRGRDLLVHVARGVQLAVGNVRPGQNPQDTESPLFLTLSSLWAIATSKIGEGTDDARALRLREALEGEAFPLPDVLSELALA